MSKSLRTLLLIAVSALAAATPSAAAVMNVTYSANEGTPVAVTSTTAAGKLSSGTANALGGTNVVGGGAEVTPGYYAVGVGGGLDLFAGVYGNTFGSATANSSATTSGTVRVSNPNAFAVVSHFNLDLSYYLSAFVATSFFAPAAVPTSVTLAASITDPTAGTLYSAVVPVVGPDGTAASSTPFPFAVPVAAGQTRDLLFALGVSGSTAGSFDPTAYRGMLSPSGNDATRFLVRVTGTDLAAVTADAAVPEPTSAAALAALAGGLAVRRRVRRSA